jgi:hypothetical protein
MRGTGGKMSRREQGAESAAGKEEPLRPKEKGQAGERNQVRLNSSSELTLYFIIIECAPELREVLVARALDLEINSVERSTRACPCTNCTLAPLAGVPQPRK